MEGDVKKAMKVNCLHGLLFFGVRQSSESTISGTVQIDGTCFFWAWYPLHCTTYM
uniref:Uncharacterized protein n=1 Tax=Arundo donax TaxID=35708 RepID=A0A0A9GHD3_ARUDO